MRWFLLPICAFLLHSLTLAQDPLINRIGPRQGLPSATVFRVLPDGPGRVWLGTENGLVHSNGHSLTHYPFTDSIYRNAVLGLCADADSGLWVSLFRQGVYHYRNQKLHKVPGPAYHLERIIGLRQDSRGTTLGLSAREGLLRLSLEGHQQVLPRRNCLSLTLVADTFWVGTDSGLYTCSAPEYRFEVFPGTEGLHIRDFNASPAGRKWMISDQGLFSFQSGQWVSANLPESREPVSYLCPDAHGYVWLAFKQRGLIRWKPGTPLPPPVRFLSPGTVINQLLNDDEGNVWISAEGQGVVIAYQLPEVRFHALGQLRELWEDDSGTLWAGGYGQAWAIQNDKAVRVHLPGLQPDELVTHIRPGPEGLLMGSTMGYWTQNESGWDPRPSPNGFLTASQDPDGQWWTGHYGGLGRIGPELVHIRDSVWWVSRFPGNQVSCLLLDHAKQWWIAFPDQLVRIADGDTTRWRAGREMAGSTIAAMTESHDTVWVAGSGGVMAIAGDVTISYGTNQGLPHPNCRDVTVDATGRVWVATEGGLAFRKGHRFIHFKLGGAEITDRPYSLTAGSGNTLWVSYPEGLLQLQLDQLTVEPTPPDAQLAAYRNDGSALVESGWIDYLRKPVTLDLHFQLLGWDHENQFRVEYRVPGLIPGWQPTAMGRAAITSLPPGDHELEYRTVNRYTGKASPSRWMSFGVSTPFYHQTWFWVLVALATIALTVVLAILRIRSIQRRNQQRLEHERHVHRLRHLALTHSLHPHYLTNSLQSLRHFFEHHSPQQGSAYLESFSRLIRLNLEDAQEPFVSLDKELVRLELYLQLEQWRFGEGLVYHIRLGPDLVPEDHILPGMVIQPIVENALWHGIMPKSGGGTVLIDLSETADDQLKVVIEDNGVGTRSPARPGHRTSLGTRLIREKLDWAALPYEIRTETVTGPYGSSGTRVTLLLATLEPSLDPTYGHSL